MNEFIISRKFNQRIISYPDMNQELPSIKTKVSFQDMIYGLGFAWVQLLQEQPKKESLVLLLAHGALESGNYNSMYCYNIGNIKSKDNDGRDYCYYKCNELVKLDYAKKLVGSSQNDGGDAVITGNQGNGFVWIYFYPKNKYCRFRAFKTLEEGCIDYLSFIKYRYKPETGIWNSVLNADVKLYCHLLRANGYYTADETIYTNAVYKKYNELIKLDFDLDKLPVLSEKQKENISNLVSLNFDQISRDMKLVKE